MKKQENSLCQCMENNGLFVPNRQLSGLVAGLLFLLFCTFMTGYFLGKKYGIEQFTQKMYNDSLDDDETLSVMVRDTEICIQDNQAHVPVIEHNMALTLPNETAALHTVVVDVPQQTSDLSTNDQKYYAQLIGFGTEKAAELFVKRVALQGITTEIKKRVSITAKGHTSYWYQVVTPAYSNKDDLSMVVNQLVKTEKLKDVCIRTC